MSPSNKVFSPAPLWVSSGAGDTQDSQLLRCVLKIAPLLKKVEGGLCPSSAGARAGCGLLSQGPPYAPIPSF